MSNCLKHLLPVAAVAAVVAFAMDVKVDYDHKTDIANYHTYCWLKAKASDSLWEDRIMQAVDRQLAARGLAKVPSGGEASVAAVGTTRQEPTFTTFYNGMRAGTGADGPDTRPRQWTMSGSERSL